MKTMDAIHDYEYYEAHAKDVKIEDITSDEYNTVLLAGLRDNNDPDFTYISITTSNTGQAYEFEVREGDHLGWLGYFVGRSKQLKNIHIESFPENSKHLNEFFRGLGQNRTIRNIQIGVDLEENFQSLVPFLTNNKSLRVLNFIGFQIGLQCARNIAFLVGLIPSLQRLEFDGADIDHLGFLHIVIALKKVPRIEALELNVHNDSLGIRRDGCVALGRMLEGWRSPNLEYLILNGDIEDEGLHALVAGLRNCHNMTSVRLRGNRSVTEAGLKSLSTIFQSDNCRLELLDLARMNIGDDGMGVLAAGPASLPSLKRLILRDNCIGDQGVRTFVDGMAQRCNLRELDLSYNRLITSDGLASFSSLLRAEHCSLRTLSLYGINIGDEGATALANGLRGSKSLRELGINGSSITARGWDAFSRLLCDTFSVNNTYLSNHTLVHIGMFRMGGTPQNIVEVLKLNELQFRAAAICKILHSYPDIDVTPLFEFNLKCLPLVVAWLEKAKIYKIKVKESIEVFHSRQLSTVYKFIRGAPQLVADGYRRQKMKDIQSDAKKRKRKRKFT